MSYSLRIGGKEDPTTVRFAEEYERYILMLLRVARAKALRIVRERRAAIDAVAAEMCNNDDLILGHRIIEIIDASPVASVDEDEDKEDEVQVSACATSPRLLFLLLSEKSSPTLCLPL